MIRFLGIFREPLHSPNRESDDAKILQAVSDELARHGAYARVMDVEPAFKAMREERFDVVAPMCEAHPVLLKLLELSATTTFINPPQAVLKCYRTSMVHLLEDVQLASFPRTEIRPIHSPLSMPAFANGHGMWIKRGDVHNTCDHDVVRVRTLDEMARVQSDFRSRGIERMVLQEHHDGDLIKFYGVGPGKWFTWFYHDPAKARKIPFAVERLDQQTAAAAAALGLEVFGGDAIVTPEGPIRIIDINSWPSFARVRAEAGVQIARHLMGRALDLSSARAVARP
jgi:hypothetical protein